MPNDEQSAERGDTQTPCGNLILMENQEPSTSSAWSYHRQPDGKDEWLTPPEIVHAVSEGFNGEMFDLDPCSPIKRPWDTAKHHYTEEDNGLIKPWDGRVWCNPPYKEAAKWLGRCAEHGNCIAMVFARTETRMFFEHVWTADAVLFMKGRVTFRNVDGSKPKFTGGGPSCLVAWGDCNVEALRCAVVNGLLYGHLVLL
jgi:hypothetical protein